MLITRCSPSAVMIVLIAHLAGHRAYSPSVGWSLAPCAAVVALVGVVEDEWPPLVLSVDAEVAVFVVVHVVPFVVSPANVLGRGSPTLRSER